MSLCTQDTGSGWAFLLKCIWGVTWFHCPWENQCTKLLRAIVWLNVIMSHIYKSDDLVLSQLLRLSHMLDIFGAGHGCILMHSLGSQKSLMKCTTMSLSGVSTVACFLKCHSIVQWTKCKQTVTKHLVKESLASKQCVN